MTTSLRDSFHPAPKPGVKTEPKPQPVKTKKPVKTDLTPKPPKKGGTKSTKRAKTRTLSHAEGNPYDIARNRARVPGGFVCERCAAFIPEGQEHAHHIVYGRLHGTRKQHTVPNELAIIGGDFSPCKCHTQVHRLGIKDPAEFHLRGAA